MVTFVNRQAELMLIDNAFEALRNNDNDNILLTPIIDFFGVAGIGKTAVLGYIEEQCKEQQIRYIFIDDSQNAYHFSREIVRQVAERYNIGLLPLDEDEDLFQEARDATRALLEQGTAVMILDSVDATDEALLERIAITLRDVINDKKLFVALASERGVLFDFERSISRQLTSFQLKPLDRVSCELYFDNIEPPLTPEIRQYIFAWTHGYPLAMKVMTAIISEQKLNLTQLEDQKALLSLIIERVIDQKVFAELVPSEQSRYKELLTVLSVPRYFNLSIMQELIEHFSPAHKKANSLAYMKLPSSIKNDTNILNWNIVRSGFAVDAPIRNIFLLKIRFEQAERYSALHRFLARLNERLAGKVTGSERVRYLCEYLYHSAHVESEQAFSHICEQVLLKISVEPSEPFEAYLEELVRDDDFRAALGERIGTVKSSIYRHLAEMNRQRARITSGERHIYNLRIFFVYLLKDPLVTDVRLALIPAIRGMLVEESTSDTAQFVQELLDSEWLEAALGQRFKLLAELIAEISLEG